jgi:hypothetical protein
MIRKIHALLMLIACIVLMLTWDVMAFTEQISFEHASIIFVLIMFANWDAWKEVKNMENEPNGK